MKNIKKTIEVLQLKFIPERKKFEVNLGVGVFHLFKGEIHIDETPYEDESLVPIKNIEILESKYFCFEALFKGHQTYFKFDCSAYDGAIDVAYLLKSINELDINFSLEFDEVEIFFDEKDLSIKLGKDDNNSRILIDYNEYGNSFCLRFPEPTKEYEIGNSSIVDEIVKVNCVGTNLDDPDDTIEGFYYEWKLSLPDEMLTVVNKLLNVGLR